MKNKMNEMNEMKIASQVIIYISSSDPEKKYF